MCPPVNKGDPCVRPNPPKRCGTNKLRLSVPPRIYRGPAGPLGCHVSIAGGFRYAPGRGRDLGAAAIQVFTRSPRAWSAPPLSDEDVVSFPAAVAREGIAAVVAHAMYLINLGSANDGLRRRGIDTFVDEINRCSRLGIGRIVIHPGSARTMSPAQGLERILDALKEVAKRTRDSSVVILLENTAGMGGSLGHSLAQLAWLIDHHPQPERLGICLDTAHALAAGYPLDETDGFARLLDEIDGRIGLPRLGCLHINDSKTPRASRVDRHARIGEGFLGREFFQRLLAEPRLFGIPKILEVPGGDDAFRGDLRLLARLARGALSGGA